MEENERELIRTRLTNLIKHTHCTTEFLTYFFQMKILTYDEIQEIAGIKVDSERAFKFYMHIQTRTRGFAVLKEGLKKYNQTGALNFLEGREDLILKPHLNLIQNQLSHLSIEQKTAPSQRKIYFDVVPPVLSFTGRTAELKQLHHLVLRSQGAERIAVVSQMTSVSGLGGIGKTQLAREYVRVNGMDFDGNVLWMNAESEESLTESFARLARRKLNLPVKDGNGRNISAKNIAEAVYNYFTGMKALFVFDNAEKAPWLREFMPGVENTQNLFILLTSRDREWDRGVEILSLDGLSEDEAINLINNGIGIDGDQGKSVQKLVQTLQYFPLALQQAVAYIYEQRRTFSDYSIDSYLEEFKTKQLELLDYREENAIFYDIFTATTATTWSMTFDKIKSEKNNGRLAGLILNVVAYLGADNIRRDLFYRLGFSIKNNWLKMLNILSYFGNKQDFLPIVLSTGEIDLAKQEQTNAAVRLLVKYSMLNGRDSLLSVHRLVQAVTRKKLARDGMEEIYLETALQLLQGREEDEFPAENIAHALIVWRHAFSYKKIIQGYSKQVNKIVWKMREVGHHNEGVRFGNEALEKFKKVLGEDHLDCLWIERSIGVILLEQGYVDKAGSIFQNILTKGKSLCGEDNNLSLTIKEDLANSLSQSGRIPEAVKILEDVLGKKKTLFGNNHSSTLATEENYGVALKNTGQLTKAENIFQRIIQIYIENGEENSIGMLYVQNNLSTIYSKTGNHEKAIQMYREVYEKLNPVWVENVDLFTAVCINLASSLNVVGEYKDSLKILKGHIEKIKERLGSQDFRTLEIQREIGKSFGSLGNLSIALDIFQNFQQATEALSGENSFPSLNASVDVAITLSLLEQHSQALFKFQDIISKMEGLAGKGNWNVIITKLDFARAVERSGDKYTALELLKNVKTAMIPTVGEDSPLVVNITKDIERIKEMVEAN